MEYKQAKLKDSNVALIGSTQDKALRLKAAQTEPAFQGAGQKPGIEIWRIEKFQVKKWPRNMYGTFYDGDSFIVLSTVKTPEGRLRWVFSVFKKVYYFEGCSLLVGIEKFTR